MTKNKINITLCDVGHCNSTKVFNYLKNFWGAKNISTPQFEILPPCQEYDYIVGYDQGTGKINIGLIHLNQLYQVYEKVGWKLDPIEFLQSYLGGQYTIGVAYGLNPDNFERANDLGLADRDYKKFIKAFGIRTQLSGIENIGSRNVARKFGFYDEFNEKRFIEHAFDTTSLQIQKLQEIADPVPQSDRETLKGIYSEFMRLIAKTMVVIGYKLSPGLENPCKGKKERYHELISTNLEPDEKYISKVEALIEERFPLVHGFIKNNLPH